jgi:hypothetical protein
LGKAVENKNRKTTWNSYNFGLEQILGFVWRIHWEFLGTEERERELENIVGNIRDISGKPLVANKIKLMCWDLRMGAKVLRMLSSTHPRLLLLQSIIFLGLHTNTRWNNGLPKRIRLTKLLKFCFRKWIIPFK